MSDKWKASDIPDQSGKLAVVTGANSGLGYSTALELARHGAEVIVASRSTDKGQAAAGEIEKEAGGPKPRVLALDLGNLDSIREFAGQLEGERIDLLINNAGIMMTPQQKTDDGFELQFGTNHLGHFALTGLLLDAIERSEAGRIVTLSSIEHRAGKLDFDDLQKAGSYSPRGAYQGSKLANAVFAVELDRRLRAKGSQAISVFAHPGYTATNLQSTGPTGIAKAAMKLSNRFVAQSVERGALPQLYAATAPGVEGGRYYGPDGLRELRGDPTEVKAIRPAYDEDNGRRLWEASEELTGVRFLSAAEVG